MDLLALCEERGVTIDGLSVLEIWLAEHGQKRWNRDRIMRDVRSSVGEWVRLELLDICTVDGFMEWAEIE